MNTKHGMSRTLEYRAWIEMVRRIDRPKHQANYADRGISVCDEWRNSFDAFYRDIGPKPSLEHSLDRIDNNGSYEPTNCRWATTLEQNRNWRYVRRIEIGGKILTATEWELASGVSAGTIKHRIDRGLSGIALLRPVRGRQKHL